MLIGMQILSKHPKLYENDDSYLVFAQSLSYLITIF